MAAKLKDRIHGATVAIAGMAKSGFAAAALLREHGARVRGIDATISPALLQQSAEAGISLLPQEPSSFDDVDVVVLSPGVPADLELLQPLRARGIPVIGELEVAGWWLRGPVIGITGSNGKTTTTALTGEILRAGGIAAQVGGNIGRPPTDMVASSRPGQWTVLELSSFQLEMTDTFRANAAVALNVTPNHLDRHHTFENYAEAKGRIFRNQQPGDRAILNADDPICRGYASLTRGTVIWFSLEKPVEHGFWLEGDKLRSDEGELMPVSEVRLRGRHNLQNVMAAAGAAHTAGASFDQIRATVQTFAGVEHRIEPVREIDGVHYYNDSKATSVDAALKAVDSFTGGLWIILGGKDKGASYAPLREPLRAKAHAALLIGSAAQKISVELGGFVPVIECETLETAVQYAHRHSTRGDTVLLAPACASFDQFRGYEHRGEVFKQLVNQLAGGNR
jgi:UDP-N-acetylmuramoylalanine--D-glutamate ligase